MDTSKKIVMILIWYKKVKKPFHVLEVQKVWVDAGKKRESQSGRLNLLNINLAVFGAANFANFNQEITADCAFRTNRLDTSVSPSHQQSLATNYLLSN